MGCIAAVWTPRPTLPGGSARNRRLGPVAGAGLCRVTYNGAVVSRAISTTVRLVPPSVLFALAFALLGWIAGHSVAYEIVGLPSEGPADGHQHNHGHGHDHGHEVQGPSVHGYMDALGVTGGVALVLALVLALRTFSRHGSFGEWLREGGWLGTPQQIALSTALPAAVFVAAEYLERLAAGTGTMPGVRLLAVGVAVQVVVGLACLVLVRLGFRVAERVLDAGDEPARRSGPSLSLVPATAVFARPTHPMADRAAGRAPPPLSRSEVRVVLLGARSR